MSDPANDAKPDGSAFKAHMEGVNSRNNAARKAGKVEREEHERAQRVDRLDTEVRQAKALRSSDRKKGGSKALIREKKRA